MTTNEVFDNVWKGFTAKEEGFSVKKMLAAIVVLALLVITFIYTDKSNWQSTLTVWLAFVTSLLTVVAVEKSMSINKELETIKDENAQAK